MYSKQQWLRIKRPPHISLLNSSEKASRYATRRQINSADGNIVAYASFGSKLQKLRQRYKLQKDKVEKEGMARQKKKKQQQQQKKNREYFSKIDRTCQRSTS